MSVKQPEDMDYTGTFNVKIHWNSAFAKEMNEKMQVLSIPM